jgi:cation:H+ antiporter
MVSVMAAAGAPGASAALFVAAAVVSLATSAVLVTRIERIGARLGCSEALLGLLAALAANAPEVTSSITALARKQGTIGTGVVLGSNVFNLAALLGLGALVAGRVVLHRRVVVFAGTIALLLAGLALSVVVGVVGARPALVAGVLLFAPYVALCSSPGLARRLPGAVGRWLEGAVAEEEAELLPAIHPVPGRGADVAWAGAALAVVVAASIVMEHTASSLGARLGVAPALVGGVVLAAVTSLPNAVAALYLARRGRGSAVLSEACNSNNMNVVVGLLVPGAALGLSAGGTPSILTAASALGLTALSLVLAFGGRGLRRPAGATIVGGYAAFLVASAILR